MLLSLLSFNYRPRPVRICKSSVAKEHNVKFFKMISYKRIASIYKQIVVFVFQYVDVLIKSSINMIKNVTGVSRRATDRRANAANKPFTRIIYYYWVRFCIASTPF